MKTCHLFSLACVLLLSLFSVRLNAESSVDFESFLAQHDMTWDRVPNRWELAPYSGNGNVGFLFYQAKGEANNVISIYAGRHDYYDHREPYQGKDLLWIYRGRLPLGHFNLKSKGDILDADLRLDLWNAEMSGVITTTEGSYRVRGLSHAASDVIYFETDATDESIEISWHPDEPFSSVRKTLDQGGGPKAAGIWKAMREAPYPATPEPQWSESNGMQFCLQELYQRRGETTTGWEVMGEADARQIMLASIHHSYPAHDSLEIVKQNLLTARDLLAANTFFTSHQEWWHAYYPQSFLTINDAEKEAFYWIQMYKLGSAMRENGPILDLMGPWYHKTFWPMVWGDLNVQLIYWTHLTANRMSVGESLGNNIDKYAGNLAQNGPAHWKDSANVATLFPQDMDAQIGAVVPDMLAWIMHNYWLHCEYAGDRERLRDGVFPVLRQTMNSYLNYLQENAVPSDDGTIHIKHSWSPEYPGGRGQDINFTISLIQWTCQTLLAINAEFDLNDPLASEWQRVSDNLVDYQIDANGLRIGKDIAFDKPHRHYSHLLAFYPLALITPETDANAQLLRTTLDHWLDVSFNTKNEAKAMAVTGYTATGAASMYAWLGDQEKAYQYLDYLIQHDRVSPTTMYAEGNPVIESPLSFATSVHDMLLQSWGGKIRVFPATPENWGDVAFEDLRTQGAFLVSAKKQAGVTQFVSVESLMGAPCLVRTDIPNPQISIDGAVALCQQVRLTKDGFYEIDLKQGQTATLTAGPLAETDLTIEPIPVKPKDRNMFGLNKKTERLPGHQHYYKK
ncbi:glycosyl hydrolase family 95 catalytic domain-containing protein [Coraliomargarita sp. W4R53]